MRKAVLVLSKVHSGHMGRGPSRAKGKKHPPRVSIILSMIAVRFLRNRIMQVPPRSRSHVVPFRDLLAHPLLDPEPLLYPIRTTRHIRHRPTGWLQ